MRIEQFLENYNGCSLTWSSHCLLHHHWLIMCFNSCCQLQR